MHVWKEIREMSVAITPDYAKIMEEQQEEVRQLVTDGLKQVKEGKTSDFNTVCDRLEKKYKRAALLI